MNSHETSVSSRFTHAIRQAASTDLGRPIPPGTSVVASAAREGSTNTVALFVRQQHRRGRFALYNCDVTNVGSDRLAEKLGFTVAQTVASVRFE